MRLFHERQSERTGALDTRDEEECFTAGGRRVGVWLTSDAARGPSTFAAEVDPADVEAFEVTQDGDEHRTFVVPGDVAEGLGFEAC